MYITNTVAAYTNIYHVHRNVCIEKMVIVLQTNCTTQIMRMFLIVLTSITSFTYTNLLGGTDETRCLRLSHDRCTFVGSA